MSNRENIEASEKAQTKYDIKMAKRAEEAKKEEKSLFVWKIVGVLAILAVVAGFLVTPIQNIVAVNRTIVTVGDHKVNRVEFDYVYNSVKDNYLSTYGNYLSYYGLTEGVDPATVAYSNELSFKDFFEKLTVEQIQQNVALEKEANAAGFVYDATDDFKNSIASMTEEAEANKSNITDYLKSNFGAYATKNRLKPYIMQSYFVSKYYDTVYEAKTPADDVIEQYYEDDKATYDSVDYYLATINATLPTEPTELAEEGATVAEDGSYTPSDAEKEAAMAEAKAQADEAAADIENKGSFYEKQLKADVNYYINSWLFDDARKAGDTTVIENSASNLYYVVGFKDRYRDETPTANIRVIITEEDLGDEIMAKFEASDKTVESYRELVKEYSIDTNSIENGGYYINQAEDTFEGEIKEWIFSGDRKYGDVNAFRIYDVYTYVIWYEEPGELVWKDSVITNYMSTVMSEYLEEITANVEVSDPKGNMKYITVQKAAEAAAAAAKETEAEEGTTETSAE